LTGIQQSKDLGKLRQEHAVLEDQATYQRRQGRITKRALEKMLPGSKKQFERKGPEKWPNSDYRPESDSRPGSERSTPANSDDEQEQTYERPPVERSGVGRGGPR
jgi:hypothetical protein